jgi:hypothetical protein
VVKQHQPPAGIYATDPLPNSVAPLPVQPDFAPLAAIYSYSPVWYGPAPTVSGTGIGVTITSTSPQFEINSLTIGYVETTGLFG